MGLFCSNVDILNINLYSYGNDKNILFLIKFIIYRWVINLMKVNLCLPVFKFSRIGTEFYQVWKSLFTRYYNLINDTYWPDPHSTPLLKPSTEIGSVTDVYNTFITFYFILSNEISVYPKWVEMIFSLVKEYDIFTSEKLQVDVIFTTCFGLFRLHSLFPWQMPIPLLISILNFSTFSVSEQNLSSVGMHFLLS